jgi:Putative auto-transporter adhesin, head GIN domain
LIVKKNNYSWMYVEKRKTKIQITLPALIALEHSGNSNVSIKGVTGKLFRLNQSGNGSITIEGSTLLFDLSKSGNGSIKANKLIAQEIKIIMSGNGDCIVHATDSLTVRGSGNGEVINTGTANFSSGSSKTGNGKLIKRKI